MKLTQHYKKLLKDVVNIAYADIDIIEEKNLLEIISSLKVQN
jgi:hypothetical protein